MGCLCESSFSVKKGLLRWEMPPPNPFECIANETQPAGCSLLSESLWLRFLSLTSPSWGSKHDITFTHFTAQKPHKFSKIPQT